jgi:hypothetical protein
MGKKLVYICHPLGGDVKGNQEKVKRICREIMLGREDVIPFAPHLYFPDFLDDDDPYERKLGMQGDLLFLRICNEVWVYGDRITKGMKKEIKLARALGIPVKYKSKIKR